MELSKGQQQALDIAREGHNICILGEGGVGKSVVIEEIFKHFTERGKQVVKTASTGCAGYLIGGSTLHSWAGIGKGEEPVEQLIKIIQGKFGVQSRWWSTDVLIVDEISMIGAELLEKLDIIGRTLRNPSLPFGGIQVVGSGDFLQLPPVKAEYGFKAPCYFKVFPVARNVVLKQNFRQRGDPTYRRILSEVRLGILTPKSLKLLLKCVVDRDDDDPDSPVRIYPLRAQARDYNAYRMKKLTGDSHHFRHKWSTRPGVSKKASRTVHAHMLRNVPCEDVLELKVGTRVMHTCNDAPLVNGSTGVVVRFTEAGLPVVEFDIGITLTVAVHGWEATDKTGTLSQLPLILAWAVTIHKIQGATLMRARIDVGHSIFDFNQIYVALSRVMTLGVPYEDDRLGMKSGLELVALDPSRIRAHPEAMGFYAMLVRARNAA
jgi:ATP-dependent DNA helicase PIF1